MILNDAFFDNEIKRKKKEFEEEISAIRYWKSIAKLMSNHQKSKTKEFTLSFPHQSYKDDESKIVAYADSFGYVITDEKLTGTTSTYTFSQKS